LIGQGPIVLSQIVRVLLKLSSIFCSYLVLFQILQFLFNNILLLDIPKNLLDIFFENVIISKYSLSRIPSCSNNFPFNCFVVHKIVDISLDLVKSYTLEVTNNIYYFS
jgi:hypothetical protein